MKGREGPTRSEQLRDLLSEGKTYREVSEELGIAVSTVKDYAKRFGLTKGHSPIMRPLIVRVSTTVATNLEAEAFRRGISRNALLARLLTIVATDNLYAAIVDDQGDGDARH